MTDSTTAAAAAAEKKETSTAAGPTPISTPTGKRRPPYKYDPDKVTLRFIFANRDGLAVTIECKPADTVGEVKSVLLSVWPEELPDCSSSGNQDRLRMVCMGKGLLMPDTKSLQDLQVPVFKTHPTPVNVSIKPANMGGKASDGNSNSNSKLASRFGGGGNNNNNTTNNSSNNNNSSAGGAGQAQVTQGCACMIL